MLRIAISLAILLLSLVAGAATSGVTYQGRIVKPDGSPLSGQYTQFKMQIRTPDLGACLMYEEIQLLDLRNSNGVFSLTIADGSGSRTDTTGLTLDRIFANRGTFTLDSTTCQAGAGTYAPNSSDGRNLVVLFKDETMAAWEPIPSQKINFVPFAFEAKQVAGFTADSLLRVVNGSGDPIMGLAPLSNAQYTELLALANGTSSNYTKTGQLNGSALPTMNSGEVLGWNGTAWVSTTSTPGANSITQTMLQSSSVGTSQIANNVSINTSGTIGAAVTTTRDFKIYAASPSTFYIDMQAPALTAPYSLVWPATAGSANQVLTTDGSGNLSWAAPAASSQWTTHGSNISYDGGGNVGIGTTSPGYKLAVVGGDASFNGVRVGQGGGSQTSNTAIGLNALSANTTGVNNTAVGLDALSSETTTVGSTAIGQGALHANVAATLPSVALGAGALYNNTTGDRNTALGTYALITSTTGGLNTAVGNRALESLTTGSNNTGIGYKVLDGSTTGSNNVALGYLAGANITTGSNNIMIGYSINAPSATLDNQLNIGNAIYGDLSSGKVGIGTTSPSAILQLKAGTASAGTAPLKFTQGTLLTTAEDGAMEYDSSGLWFTIGTTRYVIPTNTAAGNFSNVSTISNSGGSITMTPSAGNSVIVNQSTVSTSSTTGALIVNGGVGVAGAINAAGNITTGGSITVTTNGVIPQLYGSTAASGSIRIDGTSNATPGDVYLASAGGKVGIGTTSPGAALDIQGSGNLLSVGSTAQTLLATQTGFNVIRYGTNAATMMIVQSGDSTAGRGVLRVTSNGGAKDLIWADAGGNVGIGTTSPASPLEVVGNTRVTSGDILLNSGYALKWTGATDMIMGSGSSHYLALSTNSAERMRIDPAGNVGIGTSSPGYLLEIQGTSGGTLGNLANINATATNTTSNGSGLQSTVTAAPSAASTATYYGLIGMANTTSTNTSGASFAGIYAQANPSVSGKMGSAAAGEFAVAVTGTGAAAITNGYGVKVDSAVKIGGTITKVAGVSVDAQTSATNNTYLLLGTSTIPTGNYGIYSSTTNNSYLAGNVGIGTTSPGTKLSVAGSVTIGNGGETCGASYAGAVKYTAGQLYICDGSNWYGTMQNGYNGLFADGTASLPSITFNSDSSSGVWRPLYGTLGFSSNGAERMRISSTGYIGIGTTSPASALDVVGSINASSSINAGTSVNATGALTGASVTTSGASSTSAGNIALTNTNTSGVSIISFKGASTTKATIASGYSTPTSDGYLTFGTETSSSIVERMRIDAAGNVGVGTTAPGYKLDVAGTIRSSTGGIMFPDGTTQTTAAGGGGAGQWGTNSTSLYYTGGNVGIGTTSPSSRFSVPWLSGDTATTASFGSSNSSNSQIAVRGDSYSGNGVYGTSFNSAGTYGYSYSGSGVSGTSVTGAGTYGTSTSGYGVVGQTTSGTAGFFNSTSGFGLVVQTGNVGIGTTSPGYPLDVAGNANVSGTLTVGSFSTGSITSSSSSTAVYSPTSSSSHTPVGAISSVSNAGVANGTSAVFRMGVFNSSSNQQRAFIGAVSNSGASTYTPSIVFGQQVTDTTSYAERMRIDSAGNVGIGTSAPTSNLHISGSADVVEQIGPSTATGANAYLYLNGKLSGATKTAALWATYDGTLNFTHASGSSGYVFYDSSAATPLVSIGTTGNMSVAGRVVASVGANSDAMTSITADFSTKNMIRASGTSGACGTLNFTNVASGGSYTVTLPNATATCTTIQMGGSATNVKLPSGYTGGTTVSGAVYTAVYDGTTLWVSYVPF